MSDAARRESWGHTFKVALGLCVICSVLVSAAAVFLRPQQNANKERERKKNLLIAAGLYDETTGRIVIGKKERPDLKVEDLFTKSDDRPYVEEAIVDLDTGEEVDEAAKAKIKARFGKVEKYDQKKASRDPGWSSPVDQAKDVSKLKRRERYAWVYYVKNPNGTLKWIILPIRGYGLWSTLWGYLALDADLTTIRGITYYEQGETPGLGGEVDNPDWKKLWRGKKAFGKQGAVKIHVIKGAAPKDAPYEIDGLSGATITSKGVTHMLQYWLGKDGFGPFLDRLRKDK